MLFQNKSLSFLEPMPGKEEIYEEKNQHPHVINLQACGYDPGREERRLSANPSCQIYISEWERMKQKGRGKAS